MVVQGFGNVGKYAALDSYERGAKVTAVSDIGGAVMNDKGINIPELFKHMSKNDSVKGFIGGEDIDGSKILEIPCDILIPAAVGGVITTKNASNIDTKILLEGANSPTTVNAHKILEDSGIVVIPDVIANAGGVTASYFEWVQDTQNYLWKEHQIYERLVEVLTSSFEEVWKISINNNCDLRTAALMKGIKKVAAAKLTRGLFP